MESTMLQGRIHIVLGLALALGSTIAVSGTAHADGTCTTLMANVASQLTAHGGVYDFEMTMHRTDIATVSYSKGTLHGTGGSPWIATGSANQLFADRKNGSQPFNINAADAITPWLSNTGSLYIFYNTWNFSTTWDMTCSGSTMMLNNPSFGIVSLTLRAWHL
jgi:hypothetical protein